MKRVRKTKNENSYRQSDKPTMIIELQILADLATTLAAIVAAISLIVSARALTHQVRSSDFTNYINIVSLLSSAQRRLYEAKNGDEARYELTELMNVMETVAQLYNARSFSKSTRDMAKAYLVEAISFLEMHSHTADAIEKNFINENTFLELAKFRKTYAYLIDRQRDINKNTVAIA
jgi:hypothetical protein